MTHPMAPFECDAEPRTKQPRVRMTFKNGLSVSIIIRTGSDKHNASVASVAVMKNRKVIDVPGLVMQNEAFPDELAAFLAAVAAQKVDK